MEARPCGRASSSSRNRSLQQGRSGIRQRGSGLVVAFGLVGVNRLTGTGVAHQQTRAQTERTGTSGTRTEQTGGRTRGRELATGLVSAIDRCRSTIGRC